jgi:CPA1 family monovalent cation:H+ antiporter
MVYLFLFGIIVIVGQIFSKSIIPLSLILVITGMVLSAFPAFPVPELNSELILNVFLPVLIYQISAFSSWKDVRKNLRPITLLSIGHVIFITVLVALVMHHVIPELGWPLAFVLGAIVSPPDDVAIVSIAEKIRLPGKLVTILEGEGLFNDATALVLFRYALAALVTHEFYILHAANYLLIILIGETVYGLLLGFAIGEIRLRIKNPMLNIIASILTPFAAFLPAEMLGGSGIIATAAVGFIIGNHYSARFTPGFRLFSRAFWPALSFAIQNLLFLLLGLNLRNILQNIATLSLQVLLLYSGALIATIIVGRFIWVYAVVIYTPRLLSSKLRHSSNRLPWQHVFILAWAGIRGIISLAAAFAIPTLPFLVGGVNPKHLIIFLVFCVISVTFLLQGLSLPWLVKLLGVHVHGEKEKFDEHVAELNARLKINNTVLAWLIEYEVNASDNLKLQKEIKIYIREYKMLRSRLKERIANHDVEGEHDEKAESDGASIVLSKIVGIERAALFKLWSEEKINYTIWNRLLDRLDHRLQNLQE